MIGQLPPYGGCFVYFLQAVDGGPIKIGTARGEAGVKARLSAIQTGNPSKLIVTHIVPGNRQHEAAFHERFVAQRLVGEWFQPSAELAELAKAKPLDAEDEERLRAHLSREYERGFIDGEDRATQKIIDDLLAEVECFFSRHYRYDRDRKLGLRDLSKVA